MQLKKSTLALAVAAGLVAGNAHAIIDLPNNVANPPLAYASELLPANTVLTAAAAGDLNLTGTFAWGVAAGNHVYIRVELTNGTFRAGLVAGDLVTAAPARSVVALSAGGSAGSNFAVFDVSNTAALVLNTTTFVFSPALAGGPSLTYINPAQPMTVAVKFYTDSTLAASGGAPLGARSGTYVQGTPGVTTTLTPDTSIASVISDYKLFAANPGAVIAAGKVARIGTMATVINAPVLVPGTGVQVAAADLATNSTLVLTGLFSAVGTTGSIGVSAAATCATPLPGTLDANKTTATFTNIGSSDLVGGTAPAPFGASPWTLCFTADGVTPIPKQIVTAALTFTGQVSPAVVPPVTGQAGFINRDGTQLVAPLVQVPATAAPTRLVLNNTNPVDYAYTVTPLTETGVTATLTGAAAGGTVKAGETKVIELGGLITITGSTTGALRTGLKVTSPAPAGTMTGYYMLLNSNGVVSNFLLNPVE